MSVREFQKAVTYVREAQEIALFATMTDAQWSIAFRASPLFYIILPFTAFLLTINALLSAYALKKAGNKNLDQWFNAISSGLCAILASISLYGAALSVLLGVNFTIGPWFFFASLLVAMTHQAALLILSFYRASESTKESVQQMHHVQAAMSHLFALCLLSAALSSVLFVMLFPVAAPALGAASAMLAVACTVCDLCWHVFPHNWKLAIKGALYLGKPEEQTFIPDGTFNKSVVTDKVSTPGIADENPNHYRLFSRFDYCVEVKKMSVTHAKSYLDGLIHKKINSFGNDVALHDEKTKDKISFLRELLSTINSSKLCHKASLLAQYPLALQSFWTDKGEVEQIFDAVIAFQEKRYLQTNKEIRTLQF